MSSKRLFSLLLAVIMIISMVPNMAVHAAEGQPAVIAVEDCYAAPGATVTVDIMIKNNPGILAMSFKLYFDESIATLISVENGEAMSAMTFVPPIGDALKSGCLLGWDAETVNPENVKDGVIATVTFKIDEDAVPNQVMTIGLTKVGNIIDDNTNPILATTVDGRLTILDYIPGDVTGDGMVTSSDTAYLRRYIAGGYGVTINEDAGDVNADGLLTSVDVAYIRRFIAGGYNIELLPSVPKCNHTMEAVAYKAPTCTEDGNLSYYHCTTCGKNFNDSDGSNELATTVMAATGHNEVIDPAVEPTYDDYGWTEGSHCSVCNKVLKAQERIDKLEKDEYLIHYHISGSDTYLMELETAGKITNENPKTYCEGDSISLLNLYVPGFVFEGWYDGEGAGAEQIKKIENRTGTVHLYAHWTVIDYNVTFESNLIPVEAITYTVNQETVLPTPKLDGYIFAGWSDGSGAIIKRIPTGQIGHRTYTANWLSERNQAWSKTKLDEPLIYEDEDVILFVYEIGEIRNVPLYVIKDFGKINSNGVSQTVTTTYSTSISEEQMENYTKTVAKATTESFGWTLSSDWTKSTSVSEEWAEEHGMSQEEAQSTCTDESSNWYVSSGKSGTDTTVTLDTKDTYDLTTATKNTKTYDTEDKETRQDFSAELGVDYSRSTTLEVSASGDVGVAEIEGKAGKTSEFGIGLDVKYANGATTTKKSGDEKDDGSSDQDGTISQSGTTTTNSSSWNKESGYGGSTNVSNSSSVSNTISEMISNKYGYGEEYIESENQSNTQGHETSASDEDQYSSTVTYSKVTENSVTATYETTNTMSGYHRWVVAGTAHVFGVVGYDIANESYFVYTYSVMDDHTHTFEDYSYEYASYDDNQNSVISFEIPVDAADYVSDRVAYSDGLEVSKDGIITAYTGTEKFVIIPEYKVIKNLDGTATVIKVTGISATAFRNNDQIEAIELSDFITEIPDNAFENCTALKSFEGKAITKIGNKAFAGCTTLKVCELGDSVTILGTNAFDGLDSFAVHAANLSVVEAAILSGAKEITVGISDKCTGLSDTTLSIPSSTERFTFQGYGREYNDLVIDSDAAKTGIYRAEFTSTGKTPLQLASDLVVLQEVTASAPGIALICSAEDTNIYLYGESEVMSSHENAMLSKSVNLYQLKSDYYSQLHIVDGDYLICGNVANDKYLSVESGRVVTIDADAFDRYAKGLINITFNANGGTVSPTGMTAYYGSALGTLPTPNRVGYTFEGWFTEGGEQITASSVLTTTGSVTLYARWSALAYTVNWNAGTGYEIEVKRTSSPYAGAPSGTLDNGATIYYGDILQVTYSKADYYTITSHGAESITVTKDVTSSDIYATAELNELSGWVKVSELPSGAQVLDRKWTYTLTTTTESRETSLDGYTQIGSYWVQNGTGSANYASFPSGYDTGDSIYNSFMKSAYDSYETATAKRTVSNNWAGYIYWHWMYNVGSSTGYLDRAIYYKYGYASSAEVGPTCAGLRYQYFQAFTSGTAYSPVYGNWNQGHGQYLWYNCTGVYARSSYFYRIDYYTSTYTDYYKMFQYKKTENKESKSPVSESGSISNVQEWVQYRAK